jgi:tetratricopeptide (TPR) repeat protein
MNAAHQGDNDGAAAAEARLKALAAEAESAGRDYDAKQSMILAHEVAAVRQMKLGNADAAVAAAETASNMERQYMRMPSGPPKPMKPAGELYAEILLEAGRAEDAVAAFEESLAWIPLRTPSMLGLARAASAAGDMETAKELYSRIHGMPGANPQGPAMKESAGSDSR